MADGEETASFIKVTMNYAELIHVVVTGLFWLFSAYVLVKSQPCNMLDEGKA